MTRSRGGIGAGLADRLAEIGAHFKDGLSLGESGRRLGVHWSSIRYWRQKLGLPVGDRVRPAGKRHDDESIAFLNNLGIVPQALPEIGVYATSRLPVGILDIAPRACRWPLEATDTEPSRMTMYCGDPQRPRSSYCQRHHDIAYRSET